MQSIILIDPDERVSRPLTRFRSIFSQRDGILTPLERIRVKHADAKIHFRHPDQEYEELIASMEGMLTTGKEGGDLVITAGSVIDLLDGISERIHQDLKLLESSRRFLNYT